jgi:acetylornithine deacetylase
MAETHDMQANEVRDLLATLVGINSTNPDLVPGGAGESAIADVASEWLAARGFEVERLESRSGRPSVVAISRGSGDGQSLMLNGHLDTVTLAGYEGDPLDARIEGGRMYGRGSYDMKSGVAALMVAGAAAAARPHAGDIIVALVADEEYASTGTAEVLQHYTADGAIIVEPSELMVTLAHKGFVWVDVTIEGRAAHGSRSDLGVDAIAKAGRFLSALDDLGTRLAAMPGHELLGPASVHASMIRGGEERSSYPATCTIAIEWRTIPGQTGESVEHELRSILDDIANDDPAFQYHLERGLERVPFEAPRDSRVVRSILRIVEEVTGSAPEIRGEPFWTDCALYAEAGIPAVLFGVAGYGAHGATEWVSLESLDIVTQTLKKLIIDYCG